MQSLNMALVVSRPTSRGRDNPGSNPGHGRDAVDL